MRSCYKVKACCSTPTCDYVVHEDIVQTINHESSFSFAMFLNGLDHKKSCPHCGHELFFYPVTYISEPVCFE